MSTAWGIPDLRDENGVIIDATTPQDMQLIIDAQYQNAGILTGAYIGLRSDLKVDVYDGAVVMKWNNRGSVLVPVYRQTITLDPPPATGDVTVSFYVEQADTATSKAASVVMTTGALKNWPFMMPSPLFGSVGAARKDLMRSIPSTTWPKAAKP